MRQGEKMKALDDEVARIDLEIARLQAMREGLIRARALVAGSPSPPIVAEPRKRAANIKQLVLAVMEASGTTGATSAEVDVRVRESAPTVAKDTVGSVLSRLKADKALSYDGERYYSAKYAPKGNPAGTADAGGFV